MVFSVWMYEKRGGRGYLVLVFLPFTMEAALPPHGFEVSIPLSLVFLYYFVFIYESVYLADGFESFFLLLGG